MTKIPDINAHAALAALEAENRALAQKVRQLDAELLAVQELADRDPLCPVLNRRAFTRELEREIARAERYKRRLSLLFIDLDKFKQLNDTMGHEAGDKALVAVSNALIMAVRKTDIVGRLGGDEFGVILIETDVERAERRVTALTDLLKDATHGQVSASVGAAGWKPGQTSEEVLAAADQAMFRQKITTNAARQA